MTVLFKNNAYSTLAAGAAPAATSFALATGDGDLFPSPTGSEWFPVTLVKQSGEIEICKCTARSGDTLTVTRAQEGTSALIWAANERIELRLTAAALASFMRTYGGDLRVTASGGELEFSVDGGSVGTMATKEDESTFKTGMRIGYVGTTAPTGWVMASGRTIGSADSGGTERANADTADLYALLWGSYTNTELIIQDSSGTPTTRGASAAADFAANKRMPLPDYRGRVAAGKDNMGGTSANRLTSAGGGVDGDVMGAAGGSETHTHGLSGSGAGGSGSAYGDAQPSLQPTIIETMIIKL